MAIAERWFLDAWNVVDGKAFASWRGAEPPRFKAPRRKGSVFLAAPYFEPEWTSRPSTALAAWRLGFQPGLHEQGQAEIGFDNLEELREFVRRAYLGGGGGGMDPEGVAPILPPEGAAPIKPELPEGPTPEPPPVEFFEAVERILGRGPLDRDARLDLADALFALMCASSAGTLATFVADSLFLLVSSPRPKPDSILLLRKWHAVLVEWSLLLYLLTDDVDAPTKILRRCLRNDRTGFARFLANLWSYAGPVPDRIWPLLVIAISRRNTAPLVELPRWVPVPKRWRPQRPDWVLSLGDQVCLTTASYPSVVTALEQRYFVPTLCRGDLDGDDRVAAEPRPDAGSDIRL